MEITLSSINHGIFVNVKYVGFNRMGILIKFSKLDLQNFEIF